MDCKTRGTVKCNSNSIAKMMKCGIVVFLAVQHFIKLYFVGEYFTISLHIHHSGSHFRNTSLITVLKPQQALSRNVSGSLGIITVIFNLTLLVN